MELMEVKRVLNTTKRGAFTRFTYITELPLKASSRKDGYQVFKKSTVVTRFGITYSNIKGVELKDNPNSKRSNNNYWEDKSYRILCNPEKKKYYLYHFPLINNRVEKNDFIVYHKGKIENKSINEIKDIVINSYWNKKATYAKMVDIKNIINIG